MELPYFELPFFTNLLLLLVSARILGEIMERFKQPAMIGEIMAGILLGPSMFNIVHRTEEIKVISDLGVFLLVILAGLEINIEDILKSARGKNILISMIAFFLPIFSGIAVAHAFDLDVMSAVFVGLCVAITALPVSIRILMDFRKIHTELGQKIISVAIFDDVLALTILGVLLNIKDSGMGLEAVGFASLVSFLKLLIFLTVLSIAYLLIKKISLKGSYLEESIDRLTSILKGKNSLFALFLVFVLIFATITESLGFHFIVGAFFASMLISENLLGKENVKNIENTTSNMAMGFLAPIFFAGIGLEFNVLSISNIGLCVSILLVSYLSKIIGGYIGGKIAGFDNKFSLTMGIGLNARGIMELMIANIAYKAELISSEIFSILVIMGVFTTITTPLLLKLAFGKTSVTE